MSFPQHDGKHTATSASIGFIAAREMKRMKHQGGSKYSTRVLHTDGGRRNTHMATSIAERTQPTDQHDAFNVPDYRLLQSIRTKYPPTSSDTQHTTQTYVRSSRQNTCMVQEKPKNTHMTSTPGTPHVNLPTCFLAPTTSQSVNCRHKGIIPHLGASPHKPSAARDATAEIIQAHTSITVFNASVGHEI